MTSSSSGFECRCRARGDLIAIPSAGAYQLSMASNYNLVPRPAVVVVAYGQARLVHRRETYDDLLRSDVPDGSTA